MRVLRVVVVSCVLAVGMVAPAGAQDGRSSRVVDVTIDAELHTDGSLSVVEDRTFSYSGTFRGVYYTLPLASGQRVREVTLTDEQGRAYTSGRCSADGRQDPGTYSVDSSRRQWQVTWCYHEPVTDGDVTTRLSYVVEGVGTRHADAAQLYWKWIGEGWDDRTDALTATVRLPDPAAENPDEVLLWAHGPLQGEVDQPESGVVRTAVTQVPPNTYVEVRVLMPPEALPDVASDGAAVRQDIIDEEQCHAIAADAERARARGEVPEEDCDPDAWLAWVGNPLLLVGLLAGGGAWWALFRRHGKEYELPPGLADYERELPSSHSPALVGWLLGWGSVSDDALVATIMDLAERGHIRMTREMRTRERRLMPDKQEEVMVLREVSRPEGAWERDVHELLFDKAGGRSGEVTDAELKKWVEDNRDSAYKWWQSWTADIKAEAKRLHWIEPMGWVAVSVVIGVALLGVAGLAALVLRGSWLLAGLVAALGVWAIAASPLMRRRTHEGRVLHHRWDRFGAYLKDFSLIKDKTPDYLTMWGRFIVYAVPLGVADQVMRNLDASLSAAEMETVAGGWYPVGGYGRQPSFSSSMSSLSAAIPAASISSSPSSSGGGGGFSGGGGGGGGGSGGGSF